MPKYGVTAAVTNTQSSTLPSLAIVGSTSRRVKIYHFMITSEAPPNDQSVAYTLQRLTAGGTAGSNPTPLPLDPADPASFATCGTAVYTVAPTLTGNAFLWKGGVNLRSGNVFQAKEGGEFVIPATAANGLGFMPLVVNGGAFTSDFVVHFDE